MARTRLPGILWSPWSVSMTIEASAETAWELLTDPESWSDWGPTVLAGEIDGERLEAGATGRVRVPPGLWLPFEITAFEPGAYWAWTVAGVPATGHRVTPTARGCRVTFETPWWAPGYLAVCALALRRIALMLVRPSPRQAG